LAAAGGAEQGEERSVRHLEADVVDRREAAEALADVLDQDAHVYFSVGGSLVIATRGISFSRRLLTMSVTSATNVRSEATANEPGRLYSWNSFSMRSGMVSVWPAMCPETT